MTPDVIVATFLKSLNYMQHSSFPLRAAHHTAARGDSTTVHIASHLAPGYKTAASSCREMPVPVAGSIGTSAAYTRGNMSTWTSAHLAALPQAALLKTIRGNAA
jgi:hypothetical protein